MNSRTGSLEIQRMALRRSEKNWTTNSMYKSTGGSKDIYSRPRAGGSEDIYSQPRAYWRSSARELELDQRGRGMTVAQSVGKSVCGL